MSSFRRRLMMQQGGGEILPAGYTQVKYLRKTVHGQDSAIPIRHISTATATQTLSYEIDYIPYFDSSFGNVEFGGANALIFAGIYCTNGTAYFRSVSTNVYVVGSRHVLKEEVNFQENINKGYVDGNLANTSTFSSAQRGNMIVYFGLGTSSTGYRTDYSQRGDLYGGKIGIEGNLVAELIPCVRLSDGLEGLYDIVSNVFCGREGTQSLTIGY